MKKEKTITYESKIVNICDKVIEYGIYSLVFFVPLAFCNLMYDIFDLPKVIFFQFITLVIFIFWIIKLTEKEKIEFIKTSLFYPVLFFLISVFLSSINSISPIMSIFGAYRLNQGFLVILTYIIFYLTFVNNIKNKKQISNIVILVIISSSIIALYGILQKLGYDFLFSGLTISGRERNFSTMGNPMFLGGYLVMVIPLVLYGIIKNSNNYNKFFLGLSMITIYSSLIFTYSRGAWIAFILSIIFFLILIDKKLIINNKIPLLILLITITFLTLIFANQKVVAGNRNVNLVERAFSSFDIKETAANARIIIWKTTLKIIRDNPILGSGIDTFGIVYSKYQDISHIKVEGVLTTARKAHNMFLQLGATSGLLSIFAFLWILCVIFLKLFKVVKKTDNEKLLYTSLSAGIVAYIIQNQFSFDTITTGFLFWLYLGMSDINWKASNKKEIFKNQPSKKGKIGFCQKKNLLWTKTFLKLIFLIIAIFTTFSLCNILLADIYYRKGIDLQNNKESGAIKYFKKATLHNRFIPDYWLDLGDEYMREERFEEAKNSYKKYLEIDPSDYGVLFTLGFIYEKEGNYNEAIKKYESALEMSEKLNPNDFELYFRLANIYYKTNEFTKAKRLYEKVLGVEPNNKEAQEK